MASNLRISGGYHTVLRQAAQRFPPVFNESVQLSSVSIENYEWTSTFLLEILVVGGRFKRVVPFTVDLSK